MNRRRAHAVPHSHEREWSCIGGIVVSIPDMPAAREELRKPTFLRTTVLCRSWAAPLGLESNQGARSHRQCLTAFRCRYSMSKLSSSDTDGGFGACSRTSTLSVAPPNHRRTHRHQHRAVSADRAVRSEVPPLGWHILYERAKR
ncbi:hypothetical protein C8Q80DRAFT_509227 [Daedaleopsis nitida]|nr:hypothetical protein C8Q80DRAFT_509227 [Daedaleopsis nitida]